MNAKKLGEKSVRPIDLPADPSLFIDASHSNSLSRLLAKIKKVDSVPGEQPASANPKES